MTFSSLSGVRILLDAMIDRVNLLSVGFMYFGTVLYRFYDFIFASAFYEFFSCQQRFSLTCMEIN